MLSTTMTSVSVCPTEMLVGIESYLTYSVPITPRLQMDISYAPERIARSATIVVYYPSRLHQISAQ